MKAECSMIANRNAVEKYLGGRMTEREAEAFEEHYFECDRCLEAIKNHAALRAELRDGPLEPGDVSQPSFRWALAAVAAGLLIVTGLWLFTAERNTLDEAQLARLSEIEAPVFSPPRLRAVTDEGDRRFREAMSLYSDGRYHEAIDGLERVEPKAARSDFYLGVSYLMIDQPRPAIDALTRVIDSQTERYAQTARFLRGKAYLRNGDIAAAVEDFEEVSRSHGELSVEAGDILGQLGQ